MKLKRILAGVLTGAMVITGIPALGTTMPVLADEAEAPDVVSGVEWDNIAKDKTVTTSGTMTVNEDQADTVKGTNAVDGNAATKWVSADMTGAVTTQWLQIDLGEMQSPVDHITVKFDGEAWTSKYKVETSYTGKTGSWREVKTQNKADCANEAEWKTNTFDRNIRNERMVLRRYVRFTFEGLNDAEANTSTGVAVSEVEIYGTAPKEITAPTIELTAPVDGAYPEIADIKAPAGSNHHTELADRTIPGATLIQRGSNNPEWGDYVIKEEHNKGKNGQDIPVGTKVKIPVGTTSGEAAEFTVDPDDNDGVYGFTTDAQTPGVENKFNVYGKDVKIISFQLYLDKNKLPETNSSHINIFGKGDKLAMQVNQKRIYTYMYTNDKNWAEENFWFDQYDGGVDAYTNRWIDVLIVVDGVGKQRLYIDGLPAKSKNATHEAIAHEAPNDKGMQPFTIGSNLADFTLPKVDPNNANSADKDYWDVPLDNESRNGVDGTALKDKGYIARLKFYSNKNYAEIENGAGTDISDAKILSSAFENDAEKTDNPFSIEALENSVGAVSNTNDSNNQDSADNLEKRAKVYNIITNMLQEEDPTARISLCPYSRSTVWQKYDAASKTWVDWKNWNTNATERKFTDTASTKYRAVTKLVADEGFLFSSDAREDMINNNKVNANNDDAVTTVKLSEKSRYLTIMTYYGVSGDEDEAIEDNTCGIEELIVETGEDEEVKLIFDAEKTEQESVTLEKPQTLFTTCARHDGATVDISYTLEGSTNTENDYVKLENVDGALKITPKKSSRLIIGHVPLKVTVTAALKDASGNAITDPSTKKAITKTETISVEVDEPAATENEKIVKAPTIQITAPKAETYPRVADVSISSEAVHHNDVGDRMAPNATFVQLTKSTLDQYIAEDNRITSDKPATGVPATVAEPKIVNKDGVWAFSGQGQTPGLENKFDVYGKDVKVISFKLWLESWPTSGKVSIFGKGSQYAVQLDASKKDILMFMENDGSTYDGIGLGSDTNTPDKKKHGWPEERYHVQDATDYNAETNEDGFLKRWHNIFMVVDGKGYQRLYVDGSPSTTAEDRKNITGYATDSPAQGKKPFMFGYNVADTDDYGFPNWWKQLFTEQYGYMADFEFYTNKNYYNMVNGAGDDISAAQIISPELAKNIDITKLEEDHPGNLDAVITNLLQTSNPAVNISVNPYTAKTVWRQKDAEGNVSEPKPTEAFGFASVYTSTTTLTAHDGFEFDPAIKDDITLTAVAAEGDDPEALVQPTVNVEIKENEKGEANKVVEITATYGKTEAVPCTCGVESITPQTPISVEIPENAVTAQAPVPALTAADTVLTDCQAEEHTYGDAETRIFYTYSVPAASQDMIELNESATILTAKKAGRATIEIKAEYQYKKEDGTWATITNKAGNKAEATTTISVNITKMGLADQGDKTALDSAASQAAEDYPEDLADDYNKAEWEELQNAIKEAKNLAKDPQATTTQISDASARLQNALDAMADAKSPKGIAKDELKAALNAAKDLYDTKNADKTYTDASWKAFADAYEKAVSGMATAADAKAVNDLKTALTTAQSGLVKASSDSAVKDGDTLTGADGTKYQVASAKDKTVIITKGIDTKKITVGPTVVINKETYKVIGIGNGAFKGLKKATKVVINANVATIGDQAFANAKKLKNVTIGTDVTKIGKKAFFKCPKLNKVILKGKGLTNKSIGKAAFKKTAKKAAVKWGKVKGKQRTQLKKALKKAGLKVK